MQALGMRAFRSLHFCKTLRILSTQNPHPITSYCESRNYPRLPRKFHSTPHPRFPSFTAVNESIVPSLSAFPNSTPETPPVESPARQTLTVQTVYDPITGCLVTKRERNEGKEVDSGTEKDESIPSAEIGSRVYANVIGSSNDRSGIRRKGKKIRSVHVCSGCGYSDGQWWGNCRQCGAVGTMKRFTTGSADQKTSGMQASENAVKSWLPKEAIPIKLTDVRSRIDNTKWRIPL